MPLDRLIKAKKSVSGIFSRMSSAPIQPCSPKRDENYVPSCEASGPYSTGASSTVPDANDESPTIDTSSVHKGLMGSLRKQKLRSISSLRSLRSPTKTKQSDTPASLLSASPHTPKHRLHSLLVLNFEESPPDKLIFDLERKDSITSSLSVHHSSPVPVPASEKQNLQSLIDSSLIPFGTVPLSPAPIQRILELDQTGTSPSPTCTPVYHSDSEMVGRPASIRSLLSDSLQGAAAYFDEQVISYEDLGLDDLLSDKCFAHPDKSEDLRQKSAAPDAANVNKTAEEYAQVILGKGYYARAYRRADGMSRLKIKLLASDPEDGDDDFRWGNETPFRFTGSQEEKLVSELGAIIQENGITFTSDGKFDEGFAAGKLPAYLDIALDGDNAKNARSRLDNPTKIRKRNSTWGQHTGLYDGSGYGAGSNSRPVTGVTETTDVPRTYIPGALMDHENEAPTIIRRLWDTTYPHSPDTDFPGQADVGDPAISKAQEQSESPFKDYEAFQGMLDARGNA